MATFDMTFRYRFEAAHRFTQSCSEKCMTPHGHSWEACIEFEASSVDRQLAMTAEFSRLKSSWKCFIQEVVDHSFFVHYQDSILNTLRTEIPNIRLLPFVSDPTTELVAASFLYKAFVMHSDRLVSVSPVGVYMQETKTNGLRFAAKSIQEIESVFPELGEFSGWWKVSDPFERGIVKGSQKNLSLISSGHQEKTP